jgi:hypothetical protein
MKRLFYGGVILAGIFISGMLWEAHVTPSPPAYSETQLSPVIIGELIKKLKLETGSRDYAVTFELERNHKMSIMGVHLGTLPLEWGTFEATATVSVGFNKGAFHIQRMDAGLVELQFDAPTILHLEKKVHVLDHGKLWSDMHFQELADEEAERKLRTAACKSSILTDANNNVQEEFETLVHEHYPNARVIVHLTQPATC